MNNTDRTQPIDIGSAFRVYALLAGIGGLALCAWGPLWLNSHRAGEPWGNAALVRVFGSILMGAACCAAGFATVEPPVVRRRALLWFTAGHAIVWVVVLSQEIAIWGPGMADRSAQALFALIFLLLFVWAGAGSVQPQLVTLFGREAAPPDRDLRSQYEQQIRAAAKQEERNRLARDLHDSIKQQIFVVQTAAATAQTRFDADPEGARQALEQIRGAAREAVAEMQAMLDQLRAAPLENKGLIESIRKQCEALGFRTGAAVDCKIGDLPNSGDLPPGAHEAILRAAQETLANVGRHARATKVMVSLGAAAGEIELRIQDDGAGFDANQSSPGQGLANLRARAEEFGGDFELITSPGGGTTVLFRIPYEHMEAPGGYLRKAAMAGTALVAAAAYWAWKQGPAMMAPCVLATLATARYLTAYRRAVRQNEARR